PLPTRRSSDLETLLQLAPREQPADQRPERTEQQLLYAHQMVGFGEQTAIEEHATGQWQVPVLMPGDQLLRHAVAIVMGQHVQRALFANMRQQHLLQIGLLQQAIGMAARLGRVAETEHVAGDQPITLGQRRPQAMPVPTGAGKSMNQQQWLGRRVTGDPVTDRVTAKVQRLALRTPFIQGDAWQPTHWSSPGICWSSLRSSAGQGSEPPLPCGVSIPPSLIALAPT